MRGCVHVDLYVTISMWKVLLCGLDTKPGREHLELTKEGGGRLLDNKVIQFYKAMKSRAAEMEWVGRAQQKWNRGGSREDALPCRE